MEKFLVLAIATVVVFSFTVGFGTALPPPLGAAGIGLPAGNASNTALGGGIAIGVANGSAASTNGNSSSIGAVVGNTAGLSSAGSAVAANGTNVGEHGTQAGSGLATVDGISGSQAENTGGGSSNASASVALGSSTWGGSSIGQQGPAPPKSAFTDKVGVA